MNKNKIKKSIEFKKLDSIIDKAIFVGFFCIQNMSVKDKLLLKESLKIEGFNYKVVKANLLSKKLASICPKIDFSVYGSVAICYPTKNDSEYKKELIFTNMQQLFKLLTKNKNTIFLGNLFNGSLYNKVFEKKVSSLTSLSTANMESLSLIQGNIFSLLNQFTRSKNELALILAKKKDN